MKVARLHKVRDLRIEEMERPQIRNDKVLIRVKAAGVLKTAQQAVDVVKPGGTVVLIGICPEGKILLKASLARRKGLNIKLVRRMKHTYPRVIRLVGNRMVDVKSLITHEFPLKDMISAFELVEKYADGVIKAVVRM